MRRDLVPVGVPVGHQDDVGEAQQEVAQLVTRMTAVAVQVGHRADRVVAEDDDQLVLDTRLVDLVARLVEVRGAAGLELVL